MIFGSHFEVLFVVSPSLAAHLGTEALMHKLNIHVTILVCR